MAQHVQELTAFENDPEAANRLDRHWRGLSTPFESIFIGIKLRGFLEQKLSAFPLGTKVSAKVLSLNPDQIEMFGAHAGLGQRFQTMSAKLKSGLGGQSIDQFLAMLNPEIDAIQQFLALDPLWELARIELPIEQIAKIAERRESREKLTKQIEVLPTRNAIEAIGRTEDQLECATSALAWIRTVRRSSFSDSLKDRLSSLNASDERNRLREAAGEGSSLKETYQQLIAVLARDFGICDLETLAAPALVRRIAPLVDRQIELGDFLALRRQREILAQAGLADFLASADKLLIDAGRLTGIFEACVGHQRANRMRQATQALAGANGQVLEAYRKTFADRDRLIEVDRRIVKDELLRAIPPAGFNYGPRKTWTDTALLRNEFAKQARFTPVRSVLMRAAHSVQTLKPCFMMSPLSLAKFLTPAKLEFDLVVIDEASQMKPEDALGGLLRAKQIVVVGDSKQLPPSDFFTRSDGNPSSDDEFEDIEDESILEACQKSFRELRRLKWHYRSRCESLIAFSNAEFYDNTLMTFPQARPESFSVNLVRVDGAYQARCNDMEAERLIEEALKFMRHFADEDESTVPTLGIVAVNIAQRDLLREKLNRISAGDARVERYRELVEAKKEYVFVKNLENVQGDERDYILFR